MRVRLSARALVATLCSFLLVPAAFAAEPAPIRRIGFIVGANDGGHDHVKLRYAESDALTFASVLEKLGGVPPSDRIVLLSPDKPHFLAGLDDLERLLRTQSGAAKRTELIVYYSGHSDEDGLLLGDALLTYGEFRKRLESLPADVRIAVLDSCASGAMTRHKGGTWRPPFLVDDSSQVQGHAILTSSAENEAAQESDRIGGSFFTHYLVSGLRGAADASHDGRVTLSEAYQFAFNETLARTEQTQSGAQHPAFDIQLSGTGDLVMTDLRGSAARIVVESDVDGRLFLRGQDGRLAAELRKASGRAVELGVDGGTYAATLQQADGTVLVGRITVADGTRASLPAKAFQSVPKEWAVARGGSMVEPVPVPAHDEPGLQNDGQEARLVPPGPSTPARGYHYVPLSVSLLPDLCTLHAGDERIYANVALGLLGGEVAVVDGVQLALAGAFVRESLSGLQFSPLLTWIDATPPEPGGRAPGSGGLQLALGGNYAGGRFSGGQLAIGGNVARGPMRGFQLAVGTNMAFGEGGAFEDGGLPAGHFEAQGAVGLNIAQGSFYGLQLAAGANVLHAPADGTLPVLAVQMAAGLNLASGAFSGVQLGSVDLAGDRVRGVQAGLFTLNGGLAGAQIGLVNVGGEVTGVQLGLVNVARKVKGAQLGLVNVSEEITGLPVGLVNYTQGGLHGELWAGGAGNYAGSISVGASWIYSIGTVAFEPECPMCEKPRRAQALLGLGLAAPLGDWFALNLDASAGGSFQGPGSWAVLGRAGARFMPFAHLGLVAGVYLLMDATEDHVPAAEVRRTAFWDTGLYGGVRF